jgi:hypothetical protein
MASMTAEEQKALISEQQIDAVKRIYAGAVDLKAFGTVFPSLSHQKKPILACARSLESDLGEKKLHREICKRLRLPVPDGCYSIVEMRSAVVAYHFRAVHKRSIGAITGEFGPAKSTLFRQQKRLAAALELAGVSTEPEAAAVLASRASEVLTGTH